MSVNMAYYSSETQYCEGGYESVLLDALSGGEDVEQLPAYMPVPATGGLTHLVKSEIAKVKIHSVKVNFELSVRRPCKMTGVVSLVCEDGGMVKVESDGPFSNAISNMDMVGGAKGGAPGGPRLLSLSDIRAINMIRGPSDYVEDIGTTEFKLVAREQGPLLAGGTGESRRIGKGKNLMNVLS